MHVIKVKNSRNRYNELKFQKVGVNFIKMDLVVSVISCIATVGAFIAAIKIYFFQKKIALFDKRISVINDFNEIVFEELPNWSWNGSINLIEKHSDLEIQYLFDETIVEWKYIILEGIREHNKLLGDYKHALDKGNCHGRMHEEIEKEMINSEEKLKGKCQEKNIYIHEQKWLKLSN